MSAIITPTFRRNAARDFKAGGSLPNKYYIGIGRLIPWPNIAGDPPISEESTLFSEPLPQVTLAEEEDVRTELMTLVEVDTMETMIPKNVWATDRRYKRYDPTDPLTFELEGELFPSVAVSDDKIYLCIQNGEQSNAAGPSTREPQVDNITFQANDQKVGYDRGDGYIWVYLAPLAANSKLDNDQFVSISSEALSDGAEVAAAAAATGGLIYDYKINETISNIDAANLTLVLEGVDSLGAKIADVLIVDRGTIDNRYEIEGLAFDTRINAIRYASLDYSTAPALYKKASITAYNEDENGVRTKIDGIKITPLVAPVEGFGYDIKTHTPAHYAGLHSRFAEGVDGEALTSIAYRQVSVIKNPLRRSDQSPDDNDNPDISLRYSNEGAIDCLDYIQLEESEMNLQAFDTGTIMEQAVSGAKATIVHVDIGTRKVYFQQQDPHNTNFLPFDTTNNITIDVAGSVTTLDGGNILSIESSEYIHDTGEVLFIDNRKRINRNNDQIEELRIIIQF